MHEYYEFPNAEKLSSYSELTNQRSIDLIHAIEQNRNTSIIDVLRLSVGEHGNIEYIIIDMESDGVPPNNIYGIQYRERIALVTCERSEKLVEVLALRKNFPVLMHQNDSPPNAPVSLCLYFEPAISVLRTWTPQSFLKRIIWWLESSSTGNLHPSEQSVEQLFFTTNYELVLPWNYDEIKDTESSKFSIVCHADRGDKGRTFILNSGINDKFDAEYFDINLPPVVHGRILREPVTLGGLHDQLNEKGVNLQSVLAEELNSRVSDAGIEKDKDTEFTVLLLHMPILREEAGEPEAVSRRAFIITKGYLKLGEELGTLFLSKGTDNKYYVEQKIGDISPANDEHWRDVQILTMVVQYFNDSKRAREQSGINDAGINSALIGAGALGSNLLDMWLRGGWGRWSVIDSDYIKAHNISRHTAYTYQIGNPKSDVASELSTHITTGENQVRPVYADALDFSDEGVSSVLSDVNLVVDTSTTLEYPRKASEDNKLPRHISTFITPNGLSAVLMIEDDKREIKLRSLESQYYRSLINNDWGASHLGLSPDTFWSGASCRDLSFVLPYSKIVNHAGNLAEQIQKRSEQNDPFVGIWNRDPDTGGVEFYEFPIHHEKIIQLGEFKLSIDNGVIEKLNQFRQENLPNETGGALLGYYDFNLSNLVIVDVLPAPEDSDSGQHWFERGTHGLTEAINEVTNRTAGIVGYIGEWHSHPDGYSTEPSKDDKIQLTELALSMKEDGLPSIILIVGKDDIKYLHGIVIN